MSKIVEPIGNIDGGGAKPLTNIGTLPITIDGIVFNSQRDLDVYNQMTPEQKKAKLEFMKKNEVDLASEKELKKKEAIVSIIKTTAIISAIPLGLAYFSYNQKYSLIKGVSVVAIGCGVAYTAFIIYAFNGNKIFR